MLQTCGNRKECKRTSVHVCACLVSCCTRMKKINHTSGNRKEIKLTCAYACMFSFYQKEGVSVVVNKITYHVLRPYQFAHLKLFTVLLWLLMWSTFCHLHMARKVVLVRRGCTISHATGATFPNNLYKLKDPKCLNMSGASGYKG